MVLYNLTTSQLNIGVPHHSVATFDIYLYILKVDSFVPSAGLFTQRKLTREMCKPMENKCKQFLKQMEGKAPKNFTVDELTY